MDVGGFSEIEAEFEARTRRIVWCTVATVDRQGRPRTRILHPIWEGLTGWVATGRHSLKERHLASNSYVSLSYWDAQQKQV
jgi:pyridoxine/pyridoxamine 5'-phosphate oxidase